MLLAAVGAAGAVLLTADDESNKGAIRCNIKRYDTLRYDFIHYDAKLCNKII